MKNIQTADKEKAKRRQQKSYEMVPAVKRRSLRLKQLGNPNSTTRITDLNDDCLQKIFQLVYTRCLFSLAVASEWLRPAANAVFKRTNGFKRIDITRCNDGLPQINTVPSVYCQAIIVSGLKMTLQFLRCFGPSISSLSIVYDESESQRYRHIHHYISEYCSESLITLAFREKSDKQQIEGFDKPMVCVEELHFSACGNLDKQLPVFNRWFPNLHRLKIVGARVNRRYAAVTFQHLEQLTICIDDQNGFTMNDATKLLHSNHQLQSVRMNVQMNKQAKINGLLDMIKEHSNISELIIQIIDGNSIFDDQNIRISSSILRQLVKEHPILHKLEFKGCHLTMTNVVTLLSQLKSLQRIRNYVDASSDFTLFNKLEKRGWEIYPETPTFFSFVSPKYVRLTLTKK